MCAEILYITFSAEGGKPQMSLDAYSPLVAVFVMAFFFFMWLIYSKGRKYTGLSWGFF